MPTYEMPLLVRAMSRPDLVTTLKRISGVIFSKGGFIRKIENLGHQPTPYKIRSHGRFHKEASYFIFCFDVPPRTLSDMEEEYSRDMDIVRNKIFKMEELPKVPCTLHQEILPPAYRPEVKKLINIAQKMDRANKNKFKPNSGLNYYPFQR